MWFLLFLVVCLFVVRFVCFGFSFLKCAAGEGVGEHLLRVLVLF